MQVRVLCDVVNYKSIINHQYLGEFKISWSRLFLSSCSCKVSGCGDFGVAGTVSSATSGLVCSAAKFKGTTSSSDSQNSKKIHFKPLELDFLCKTLSLSSGFSLGSSFFSLTASVKILSENWTIPINWWTFRTWSLENFHSSWRLFKYFLKIKLE